MTATAQQLEYLKNSIKSIQDYPKPGILFRDVTSLLEDPKAYALSIELLVAGGVGRKRRVYHS